MRIHLIHGGSRLRIGALAALATVCFAGPALAASGGKPEKGKTYSGFIRRNSTVKYAISFKVSKTGKTVSHFSLTNTPFYCSGGGFPVLRNGKPAPVSKTGTFKAKLPLEDILGHPHKRSGTVTVTGKFGRKGHEKGEVITSLKGNKSCSGKSPYSTKAG